MAPNEITLSEKHDAARRMAVVLCASMPHRKVSKLHALPEHAQAATFAGGCFWCTESDFQSVSGVLAVVPGYTGGSQDHPTYQDVCSGRTGHIEAVQVFFDPHQVRYETLLDRFWRMIDPIDAGGQFVDRGAQYRTAIFYHDAHQRHLAEQSLAALNQSGRFTKPVVTAIEPLKDFYPAEAYHHRFYQKNPERYRSYRTHSGRDQFLDRIWRNIQPLPQKNAAAHEEPD